MNNLRHFLRPWTCRSCVSRAYTRPSAKAPYRSFASRVNNVQQPLNTKSRKSRGLITFAVVLTTGTGFVFLTETGDYCYGAVARTGRVAYTLSRCISDYKETLDKREKLPKDEYRDLLKACHKRCAERTLRAMEKNGSVFIKLGQHLSSLNYLLPSEWCDTFIPLQDKCPVSSFETIKNMVEKDTKMKFEDLFTDFEDTPLGSASLAQVHRAIDKESGRKVAVKVQHPVLDHWAPLDLALTAFTFRTLKRAFPEYDLTWLSDEMQVSLPTELNFVEEGENARKAKEYFSQYKNMPLVIPDVMWAKRRVLVMEYITGHRLDDLEYLDSNDISRDEVSATLARIFNTMIFSKDAPLHCDPHGGNIAIRVNNSRRSSTNFDVILYDHGLYRTIPLDLQRNYAKLWLAVLEADEANMRKYAKATAGITDEQFPLFASAITGRDYRAITNSVTRTERSADEKKRITDALQEGLLQQLVQLLGQVPRVILLVLKTNDLSEWLQASILDNLAHS